MSSQDFRDVIDNVKRTGLEAAGDRRISFDTRGFLGGAAVEITALDTGRQLYVLVTEISPSAPRMKVSVIENENIGAEIGDDLSAIRRGIAGLFAKAAHSAPAQS